MTLFFRHCIVISLLVLLSLVSACDPCRTLAEKICDCEESGAARDNCKRSLDTFSNMQSFSFAERTEICQEKLKDPNCSCLAIRNGQLENCGMTR